MKPTLLVLAAGMGSRFGGLKQMAGVGPNGEWILDYSVRDAAAAGFGKIVFVIRREMEADFRRLTEAKYAASIELSYAFQSLEDTPISVSNLESRQKPWGTAHAVYAARDELDSPFAVINADDFYGKAAFETLANFLNDASKQAQLETYALVGYKLANTLSEHGTVSRGVCKTSDSGLLHSIEEHSEIGYEENGRLLGTNSAGERVMLPADTLVSLNCWAFPKGWANKLESLFTHFLESHGHEARSEFYLPSAVDELINSQSAQALALPCDARWLGVTYREDLPSVQAEIATLHQNGSY